MLAFKIGRIHLTAVLSRRVTNKILSFAGQKSFFLEGHPLVISLFHVSEAARLLPKIVQDILIVLSIRLSKLFIDIPKNSALCVFSCFQDIKTVACENFGSWPGAPICLLPCL